MCWCLRLRTAVALKVGKRVVIDNTNLRARYVSEYIKIAIDMGLSKEEIKIKRFDVDVEAATERVKQRKKFPVPKEVIQQQHDALVNAKFTVDELWEKITAKYIPRRWYLPPFEVNPRINDNSLPKAVICDLDGTLAHRRLITSGFIQYRSFFDYAKCGTDIADLLVTDVVKGLRNQGYTIIFVSGRKSSCIDITKDFIQRATGFKENEYLLFMRNELQDTHHNTNTGRIEDDSDDIVKYRLYNEYIRGKYNVVGAIDDRKRVVALWEQLGLRVLNVGLLNEEF